MSGSHHLVVVLSSLVVSDSLRPPWTVAYQAPLHGIFQARILEWLPRPTPGDIPYPGIKPTSLASPAFIGRFFTTEPPGKVHSSKQRNTTKLGKNNSLPEICFPVFIGYMAGQLDQ